MAPDQLIVRAKQNNQFCIRSGRWHRVGRPRHIGYARVPLRLLRGDLAGQLATLPRGSLACGNATRSPRYGNSSHRPPPRTDWVAAMITPTTVAVVLGGVAVLPGGGGVSGPATVNLAPSA